MISEARGAADAAGVQLVEPFPSYVDINFEGDDGRAKGHEKTISDL